MFRAYIYKLITSPLLYIGIIGVTMLCCTNFISYNFFYGDVVRHVESFLNIGIYRKAMAVFGAIPFTANFTDEWTSGVTMQCITRKSIKQYAVSNIMFCAFTAFFTVFAGMMLFPGLYSLAIPFYVPDGNPHNYLFGQFLIGGHEWIYLTLKIFVFAVSCAMWAVMGMLLSVFFPNKYVAICSPFVASYLVERITIQFPDNLNLWYISLSFVDFKSDLLGFIYCIGIFAAISVLCGFAFVFLIRKRVQNEIT